MSRWKMMFLSLMPVMFAMNIRLHNWHHICNVQYSIITNVNGLMAKLSSSSLSSSLSISLTTLWIYNTVILLDTNTRFYRAWSLFYTAVYQHVNMVRLCMSRCYNGYSTTLVRKKSCIQRPAVPLWPSCSQPCICYLFNMNAVHEYTQKREEIKTKNYSV